MPIIISSAPESFARVPIDGRGEGSGEAGPDRGPGRQQYGDPPPGDDPGHQQRRPRRRTGRSSQGSRSSRDVRRIRRSIVSARPSSPPASRTDRERWASPPIARSIATRAARASDRGAETEGLRVASRRRARRSRLTAAPTGNVIAAPTSAPKRPGAKTTTAASHRGSGEDRDRPAAGSAGADPAATPAPAAEQQSDRRSSPRARCRCRRSARRGPGSDPSSESGV